MTTSFLTTGIVTSVSKEHKRVVAKTDVGEFLVEIPWWKLDNEDVRFGSRISVKVVSCADQFAEYMGTDCR